MLSALSKIVLQRWVTYSSLRRLATDCSPCRFYELEDVEVSAVAGYGLRVPKLLLARGEGSLTVKTCGTVKLTRAANAEGPRSRIMACVSVVCGFILAALMAMGMQFLRWLLLRWQERNDRSTYYLEVQVRSFRFLDEGTGEYEVTAKELPYFRVTLHSYAVVELTLEKTAALLHTEVRHAALGRVKLTFPADLCIAAHINQKALDVLWASPAEVQWFSAAKNTTQGSGPEQLSPSSTSTDSSATLVLLERILGPIFARQQSSTHRRSTDANQELLWCFTSLHVSCNLYLEIDDVGIDAHLISVGASTETASVALGIVEARLKEELVCKIQTVEFSRHADTRVLGLKSFTVYSIESDDSAVERLGGLEMRLSVREDLGRLVMLEPVYLDILWLYNRFLSAIPAPDGTVTGGAGTSSQPQLVVKHWCVSCVPLVKMTIDHATGSWIEVKNLSCFIATVGEAKFGLRFDALNLCGGACSRSVLQFEQFRIGHCAGTLNLELARAVVLIKKETLTCWLASESRNSRTHELRGTFFLNTEALAFGWANERGVFKNLRIAKFELRYCCSESEAAVSLGSRELENCMRVLCLRELSSDSRSLKEFSLLLPVDLVTWLFSYVREFVTVSPVISLIRDSKRASPPTLRPPVSQSSVPISTAVKSCFAEFVPSSELEGTTEACEDALSVWTVGRWRVFLGTVNEVLLEVVSGTQNSTTIAFINDGELRSCHSKITPFLIQRSSARSQQHQDVSVAPDKADYFAAWRTRPANFGLDVEYALAHAPLGCDEEWVAMPLSEEPICGKLEFFSNSSVIKSDGPIDMELFLTADSFRLLRRVNEDIRELLNLYDLAADEFLNVPCTKTETSLSFCLRLRITGPAEEHGAVVLLADQQGLPVCLDLIASTSPFSSLILKSRETLKLSVVGEQPASEKDFMFLLQAPRLSYTADVEGAKLEPATRPSSTLSLRGLDTDGSVSSKAILQNHLSFQVKSINLHCSKETSAFVEFYVVIQSVLDQLTFSVPPDSFDASKSFQSVPKLPRQFVLNAENSLTELVAPSPALIQYMSGRRSAMATLSRLRVCDHNSGSPSYVLWNLTPFPLKLSSKSSMKAATESSDSSVLNLIVRMESGDRITIQSASSLRLFLEVDSEAGALSGRAEICDLPLALRTCGNLSPEGVKIPLKLQSIMSFQGRAYVSADSCELHQVLAICPRRYLVNGLPFTIKYTAGIHRHSLEPARCALIANWEDEAQHPVPSNVLFCKASQSKFQRSLVNVRRSEVTVAGQLVIHVQNLLGSGIRSIKLTHRSPRERHEVEQFDITNNDQIIVCASSSVDLAIQISRDLGYSSFSSFVLSEDVPVNLSPCASGTRPDSYTALQWHDGPTSRVNLSIYYRWWDETLALLVFPGTTFKAQRLEKGPISITHQTGQTELLEDGGEINLFETPLECTIKNADQSSADVMEYTSPLSDKSGLIIFSTCVFPFENNGTSMLIKERIVSWRRDDQWPHIVLLADLPVDCHPPLDHPKSMIYNESMHPLCVISGFGSNYIASGGGWSIMSLQSSFVIATVKTSPPYNPAFVCQKTLPVDASAANALPVWKGPAQFSPFATQSETHNLAGHVPSSLLYLFPSRAISTATTSLIKKTIFMSQLRIVVTITYRTPCSVHVVVSTARSANIRPPLTSNALAFDVQSDCIEATLAEARVKVSSPSLSLNLSKENTLTTGTLSWGESSGVYWDDTLLLSVPVRSDAQTPTHTIYPNSSGGPVLCLSFALRLHTLATGAAEAVLQTVHIDVAGGVMRVANELREIVNLMALIGSLSNRCETGVANPSKPHMCVLVEKLSMGPVTVEGASDYYIPLKTFTTLPPFALNTCHQLADALSALWYNHVIMHLKQSWPSILFNTRLNFRLSCCAAAMPV